MNLDTLIIDAFGQWLEGEVSLERVRRIDLGEPADALWRSLAEHGFADLLLPEAQGGAAASAQTACRLLFAAGGAALPLPLASTWWVRAALAETGLPLPEGPIALATGRREGATLGCRQVPFAASAQWLLAELPDGAWLLPLASAQRQANGVYASLAQDLSWPGLPADALRLPAGRDWRALGAAFSAALIAGAGERVLQLTLEYANTRQQFGKPIGRFQAIQQQLSVLAEEVFAARMAAQLALHGASWPASVPAAVAKARCSAAAERICAIAHGVLGAIGVTEEYDLQLYTRRLHEWRADYGSESAWQPLIGRAALDGPGNSLAFLERHLPAA
ncbi:acyl-CoA dehydrogenase family protein [Pseudomonas citronellolis]|uniref:acyl-CoA dehydrogenase family protein n=1 Tax=Pseudomonas citronellolis TaxID=53408 RepID=UPI0021BFE68E|nr:acyl-CoA dehydrogenase family protein [Pseudomonas citronellolis]UXJ49888.1 acyl-CoA dehydrogenase family protein [Pseudomonas citronellolis]